jgi:hypothetical protein
MELLGKKKTSMVNVHLLWVEREILLSNNEKYFVIEFLLPLPYLSATDLDLQLGGRVMKMTKYTK